MTFSNSCMEFMMFSSCMERGGEARCAGLVGRLFPKSLPPSRALLGTMSQWASRGAEEQKQQVAGPRLITSCMSPSAPPWATIWSPSPKQAHVQPSRATYLLTGLQELLNGHHPVLVPVHFL